MNRQAIGCGLAAIVMVLNSCGRSGGRLQITESRTLSARSLQLGMDSPARFGYTRQAPPAKQFTWSCPQAWRELAPTEFRLANFEVPGKVQCYLTVLGGRGGGVLNNVNRWRGQYGLDPMAEADLDSLTKLQILGQPALRADIVGRGDTAGTKMIGLIVPSETQTVFVKMIGPEAALAAQLAALDEFVGSLRRPGQQAELRWTVPGDWQTGAAHEMRLVTVRPKSDPEAECYVTSLNGDGGGVLMNVNRWRKQLDLAEIDDSALAKLPRLEVLGKSAILVELFPGTTGDGDVPPAAPAMLGLVCALGDRCIFVKMSANTAVLRKQRSNFLAFCKSLEL